MEELEKCTVKYCSRKQYARKWCRQHYRHVVEGGHDTPIPIIENCINCSKNITPLAGSSGLCKACYKKQWKENTSWDIKGYQKKYRLKNKDKINEQVKKWRKKNKKSEKKYYAQKRKEINYRLAHNLRSRVYDYIKGRNKKNGSAVKDLGCSIENLKEHLETQFESGMSWDNYGKWHIDHIKPLNSFNLADREQFKKACHYSNLQPMWAKDNMSKGDRYE